MDSLALYLIAIPALPLTSAVLIAVLGPRFLKGNSHLLTVVAFLASFACSLLLVREVSVGQSQLARATAQNNLVPTNRVASFERIVPLWNWLDLPAAYDFKSDSNHSGAGASATSQPSSRALRLDVALRADGLTSMMLAMVTGVASLVAIFAAGYMHGDRGYWRFFAYVSLFVFSMTMLVAASNFVMLFVFWEAVGVCSYLLIGFWYEKPEAAAAGKKAFLVNRIGDFAFILALFLIWTTYGTLNFHDTNASGEVIQTSAASLEDSPQENNSSSVVRGVLSDSRNTAGAYVGGGTALAICLLLLLGACGKSAQFPLHVWLPDAMEGPTPVSALIHAATMVTAGIYMVARCTPLFMVSPEAQLVVACIGTFTALMAGLIALTQYDLKRVLAYSTVSQLGFMFLGLGVGTFAGITAGMFHLFTHAFFKALLFLGAGSVMHAMGHIIDMRRFSGLRRVMPLTHITFLVGCIALAGIPPLAGFFSKDAILAAVEEKVHHLQGHEEEPGSDHASTAHDDTAHQANASVSAPSHASGASLTESQRVNFGRIYHWLYYTAMFTAFLTAFYTFRAFYMTFYGPLKIPHEAGHHAHESPAIMWVPLAILAFCSIVAGMGLDQTYASHPTHLFAEFIATSPSLANGLVAETKQPYQFHMDVAAISTVIAVVGWLLSTYLYLGDHREVRWLKSLFDFELASRWFDVETVSRWKNIGWIAAAHRFANRYGFGGVTSTLGHVALLIVLILSTPFLLGNYFSPYRLSSNKFYFDEIYQLTIVFPLKLVASTCYALDRWIVDGLVNLLGRIPVAMGSLLRSLQMGLVQFYALAMVIAILIFAAVATGVLWAAG